MFTVGLGVKHPSKIFGASHLCDGSACNARADPLSFMPNKNDPLSRADSLFSLRRSFWKSYLVHGQFFGKIARDFSNLIGSDLRNHIILTSIETPEGRSILVSALITHLFLRIFLLFFLSHAAICSRFMCFVATASTFSSTSWFDIVTSNPFKERKRAVAINDVRLLPSTNT